MLLKNLMEEKQLNYDQPLLSVRRSEKDNEMKTDKSLPVVPRLPHYKTELKSGPVTNPGTVPFYWEQRPGRPKEEIKQHDENSDRSLITPKLPPGKSSTVNQQDCDKVYKNSNVDKSQARNAHCDVQSVQSQDEDVNNFERCNKTVEKESSHSEESDEAYVDALDTFSSSESIFLNFSTSGLSSFDELDGKPSGSFSTDPLTRDDRLVPPAKDMALDKPQFVSKKQPIVQEKQPSMQHGPILVKHFLQFQDDEEEESDDDNDQRGNLPAVCGLLPRFCLKRPPLFVPFWLQSRSDLSDRNSVSDRISLRSDFNLNSRQRQNPEGSMLPRKLRKHSTSMSFDELPNKEKGVINYSKETKNQGINGSESHKKGYKTFGDFLSEKESTEDSSHSGIPVVVQKGESPSREPISSNMQGLKEEPGSTEREYEVVTKMTDQFPLVDCSLKDINKLEAVDGEKLLPDSQKFNDINVESSISNSIQKGSMEASKVFEPDQEIKKDSTTAANVAVTDKGATESSQKQQAKTENRENFHQSRFQFPLPPPSPIAPSESWLQRTLPSMATKNTHIRSHLRAAANPQKQVSKAQPGDLKWETLVKTTKVQQH
ncbi:uncharacterized protein LOC111372442 [Olea europaea var. sylvestris]|uniref:uncharacterized protein LOC111372442 n=1 Tax=Olea europaea var. sylvestris TaxID=158386 RepID=UPI000C1D6314|nr:uncharacterized protein LOC111372442 [Olea europaea var. sylvestris]